MARHLLALIFAVVLVGDAHAQSTLTADLSARQLALAGSPGAVTLFGTIDAPGDVVVVVRGPESDAVVRRGPFGNFWLTAHSVAFGGVPGFYAAYASAPLDKAVPPDVQALHQIGLANLRFQVSSTGDDSTTVQQYRADLIAARQRAGLYIDTVGKVAFDGGRLFRATLTLPAAAPAGSYFIEVLLLRDKALVGGQTMSLTVTGGGSSALGGIGAWTLVLYGALAVLAAIVAGGVALRLYWRRPEVPAAAPEAPPLLEPHPRPRPAKRARRR